MEEEDNLSLTLSDTLDEETVDDPEQQESLQEVLKFVKPYLRTGKTIEDARGKFIDLGVDNLSHLANLTEDDAREVIPPLKLRDLKTKMKNVTIASTRNVTYVLDTARVLSLEQQQLLASDEPLSDTERKLIFQMISLDIEKKVKPPIQSELFDNIAKELVRLHPNAFGAVIQDELELDVIHDAIVASLSSRIKYLRSKKRSLDASGESAPKRGRKFFTVHQEYALVPSRDNPAALPDGETEESQERARLKLIAICNGNGSPELVCGLMEKTYVTIRHDINSGLNLEELLNKWPYIGKVEVIEHHFQFLMENDLLRVFDREKSILPKWIKYFQYLSTQKRSNSVSQSPKQIRNLLRRYESRTFPGRSLITTLLCLISHLSIPPGNLFMFFDNTTTFDEIQAHRKLPKHGNPFVAVLGKDPFAEPKAYVVIDKRVITRTPTSLYKAIHLMFQVYFVYKMAYELVEAPILEFIQRDLYRIHKPDSSKVARSKGENGHYSHSVKERCPRYVTLKANFKKWELKYGFNEPTAD